MIAFFAYPEAEPMVPKFAGTRSNLPLGFDHVSIGVDTKADLFALKDRLMAAGLKVSGPVDHGFIWSIYFDDPNNIPLEISWQYMEIEKPPAIADDDPVEFSLEGADPQPGHWPEVTDPTPEASWSANPGNGYDILEAIQQSNRGKAVGE
jgi:hypothetical protein